ncbi:MAG TPA: GNAT family N-acetyltransferase [Streptosporangiaceae bacterium]|nr:GNAT family N-acetyltransferase [Streptosporangiaceae bacterium]
MQIERFDPLADTAQVRACYELVKAGKPFDEPKGPLMSFPVFAGWFGLGWTVCPRESWLVPDGGQTVAAGAYLLELPAPDNPQLGQLTILVAPDKRRAGLGTALLRHAAQRAREQGRTLLSGDSRQGSPGSAFARAAGARAGPSDIVRVLDLAALPDGHLDRLRQQAEAAARGYTLLSWSGPAPDEYLDQLAVVNAAVEDAPRAAGEEVEYVDAQRIRQWERRIARQGLRDYTIVARSDETGDLAALTQFDVEPEQPEWGFQALTAVARPHRGHRLGLLVKLGMLDLLAKAEPQLRWIKTDNAGSNQHMIAINEQLGFQVFDEWETWQVDVAQVIG